MAADNAWAARALVNCAQIAALKAASCRGAEIVADAERRWSCSALRTSHKRATTPPLLTPDMFAACRTVHELEKGAVEAEPAPPLEREPLVVEEEVLADPESSDSSESDSESDSDGEEEDSWVGGQDAGRGGAGAGAQARGGGDDDMEVDAAAAADAGSTGQAAPAKPAHVHAGVGCCAGGAVLFQLPPPEAKAATPPPGSAFP